MQRRLSLTLAFLLASIPVAEAEKFDAAHAAVEESVGPAVATPENRTAQLAQDKGVLSPDKQRFAVPIAQGERGFLSIVFYGANGAGPTQQSDNDEYLLMMEGRGVLTLEGVSWSVEEDTLVYVPAGTESKYQAGPSDDGFVRLMVGPQGTDPYQGWSPGLESDKTVLEQPAEPLPESPRAPTFGAVLSEESRFAQLDDSDERFRPQPGVKGVSLMKGTTIWGVGLEFDAFAKQDLSTDPDEEYLGFVMGAGELIIGSTVHSIGWEGPVAFVIPGGTTALVKSPGNRLMVLLFRLSDRPGDSPMEGWSRSDGSP